LLRLAQDAAALNSASAARLLRALDFAEASLVAGHPG
jgi:hypothetical protein